MNKFQVAERFFNSFTYALVALVLFSGTSLLWDLWQWHYNGRDVYANENFSLGLNRVRETALSPDADKSRPRNPNCRFWDCLNLYRCGQNGNDHLTIYVYQLQNFVDAFNGKLASTLTREYYQIIEAVISSPYYSSNPNEACLFLPSIDLLNEDLVDPHLANKALAALEHWDDGKNHILFNMLPGSSSTFNFSVNVNTDRAIVLGGGFDTWTYRDGFDVSLPIWSPALNNIDPLKAHSYFNRKYLVIFAQLNIFPEQFRVLESLAHNHPSEILFLQSCDSTSTDKADLRCSSGLHQRRYEYPHVLAKSTFCFLGRSIRIGQPDLLEMLAHACIPVIVADNYVLPFEDVIDWSLASVRIPESHLHSLISRLDAISHVKILELMHQVQWLYNRYFRDLRTITLTALQILEGRIFPHHRRSIKQWNSINNNHASSNPLFLPLITTRTQGFTAVILTYDRVENLFTLIQKLALVPSLHSILVVWNNQQRSPPHLSSYPSISKPIKVIQTRANKLSNRFYPYSEIETEAILTIDDDIIMLTTDEVDFGFEVWREFPDRIVGFPSRIHIWDNSTMRWYYESEWTNRISMVLTGAAFHHKFWSHVYTYAMPGDIKEWVDEHMNCEDIAMNFLVANITNKAPIKVTPRKKFKCPECTNTEMLSADLNHMRERSNCIDRFAYIYGHMPLRSVEFRADPVLFKDNFPEKLKRFNNIGSL